MLVSMAIQIIQARAQPNQAKIIPGTHWAQRFLSRHPGIKLKYCQYLEKVRAKATVTIEEQRQWYRKLQSLMQRYKIIPENLWNCDEKGIIMGLAVGRQKAIARAGSRTKVAVTNGSRGFCSVNAVGRVIQPFIVWANKVHCIGFMAIQVPTCSRLQSLIYLRAKIIIIMLRASVAHLVDIWMMNYVLIISPSILILYNSSGCQLVVDAYCGWPYSIM